MFKKLSANFIRILINIFEFMRSILYRRDKSIILFGAWFGERFADNSRFLYQYLCENKEELGLTHIIWVTRDKSIEKTMKDLGYEVYILGSEKSDKYHKKAGVHILCNNSNYSYNPHALKADIDTRWSYGAVRINLWHGVGVVKGVSQDGLKYKRKKEKRSRYYSIKESMEKNKIYRLLFMSRGGWSESFFLSPTPTDALQFSRFKYISPEKFIYAGYPRTCKCIKLLEDEKKLLEQMANYKLIVLYLPTFRIDASEDECICLSEKVQDILLEYNILWIQKAHSASQAVYNKSKLENNIINLKPQFDINVIMPHIDILVTDYSSAASDARYFRKRILFYIPDYEEYKNGENGFTPEADELLYGSKYYTVSEFRQGLLQVLQKKQEYLDDEYERIRDKYWGETMDMGQIWEKICAYTGYKYK